MLKNMIPIEDDKDKPSKILVTTRGMKTKEISNEVMENNKNDISQGQHIHNYMWECTSLRDIKNIRELKFNIIKTGMNRENGPKDGTIESIDNSFVLNVNEDLAKYVLSLEKLIIYMHKQNVEKLALSCEDKIFELISIEYLNKIYNEVHRKILKTNKYRNYELNIILYKPLQHIKDRKLQMNIIKEFHDSPLSGHFGIRKTVLKLKQRYVWKNMRKMVRDYINKCDKCMRNKQTKYVRENMVITETPNTSFETIEIDTVGPLRMSNGYRYILTMQCELTKYVVAHPIEAKDAKNIAKTLVEQFILKYGFFRTLKSDRGTEFNNELLKEVCKLLNINQKFSAPYHHQSIGSVERNHRVLNEYLLSFVDDHEWDKWVPYYTFAYNTVPHVDTNYSPYELIYGKLATLPTDKVENRDRCYNIDNYANEIKIRLRKSLENAKKLLEIAKQKSKIIYDRNVNNSNFKENDLVLIKLESRKKNQSPYKGPYRIIKRLGVNSLLKIGNEEKIYHNNLLKMYRN